MHIYFERSGGFMGMTRSADLDWDELGPPERDDLALLIENAGFFDLPEEIAGAESVADDFVYAVEIETSEKTWKVTTTGEAAPDRLRPLLDWLDRVSRRTD